MYTFSFTDALTFLNLSDKFVSEDLSVSVQNYINTHLNYLNKCYPPTVYCHYVCYAVNLDNKIVGFRYLYHEKNSRSCCLFAIYVAQGYRRNGIARKLILESFSAIEKLNFTEFKILLTEPTPGKDALFNLYCSYAAADVNKRKFVINYWTKIKYFGYSL